jgi:cell pole-organizing protein PopZ
LEDKVAALGRLVARGTQDFEEERDRPDADELAAISEPMTWPEAPYEDVPDEDVAEESNVLHAEDAWPQSQAYQTPVAEEFAASTAVAQTFVQDDTPALEIDEETLRQMVVDIVRQELQGALGERITRNVRKLVRREIHRMLISQDFD